MTAIRKDFVSEAYLLTLSKFINMFAMLRWDGHFNMEIVCNVHWSFKFILISIITNDTNS